MIMNDLSSKENNESKRLLYRIDPMEDHYSQQDGGIIVQYRGALPSPRKKKKSTRRKDYRACRYICFACLSVYSLTITIAWYCKLSSPFICLNGIRLLDSVRGKLPNRFFDDHSTAGSEATDPAVQEDEMNDNRIQSMLDEEKEVSGEHIEGGSVIGELTNQNEESKINEKKGGTDIAYSEDLAIDVAKEQEKEEQKTQSHPTRKQNLNMPPPEINKLFTRDSHDNLVVDVASIGCHSRKDLMDTQRRTWASHTSVRKFWKLTEDDDPDPRCADELNVEKHMYYCGKRLDSDSEFMLSVRNRLHEWTTEEISGSKNPRGWLCAQRRPGSALAGRVAKWYKTQLRNAATKEERRAVLPDYLFLVDDDTFINLNHFNDFMRNRDPEIPMTYAGCLLHQVWNFGLKGSNRGEWHYPYGGYGLFLSRGSIERLIQPLRCDQINNIAKDDKSDLVQFEKRACDQVNKNFLNEKFKFTVGQSVSDIGRQISSQLAFCLHSDWLTGYLVNYYDLSSFNSYTNSNLHQYQDKKCIFNRTDYCDEMSHVCHYQTSESMEKMKAILPQGDRSFLTIR